MQLNILLMRSSQFRKVPSSARKVRCSSKRASKNSAACRKVTYKNPSTKNIAHLADSTASGNQNMLAGVPKKLPRFRRFTCIPRKPLQSEQLHQELIAPELVEQEQHKILQQEMLLPEPLLEEILEPVSLQKVSMNWDIELPKELQLDEFQSRQPHRGPVGHALLQPEQLKCQSLEPLLGQSSTMIQPHNRLQFSDTGIGQDNMLIRPANINDVLPLPFLEY